MSEATPEATREATLQRNRALVERYFECMRSGAPELPTLLAEDVRWLAPQSSPVGRVHDGKAAVLELMAGGVGLYDASRPLEVEIEAMAAEGDRVFVELVLSATTGGGEPYRNQYVFVFRIRDGAIVEIHEHLDTLYAQRKLFDPIGRASPLDGAD